MRNVEIRYRVLQDSACHSGKLLCTLLQIAGFMFLCSRPHFLLFLKILTNNDSNEYINKMCLPLQLFTHHFIPFHVCYSCFLMITIKPATFFFPFPILYFCCLSILISSYVQAYKTLNLSIDLLPLRTLVIIHNASNKRVTKSNYMYTNTS